MANKMKALILSGGAGTEMEPLSRNVPKTMLYLHGKPVIRYVIDGLINFGIRDFVVVVGHLSDVVIRYLQGIQDERLRIKVVYQGNREGVAGAILAAKTEFDGLEKFVLAHGDIVAPLDFYEHLSNSYQRSIHQNKIDGIIITTLKGNISDYGVVTINEKGFITRVIQNPSKTDLHFGNYIVAGAAILPTKYLELLDKSNSVEKAYNDLIDKDYRLQAAIWDSSIWVDLGIPWDLLDGNKLLFEKENRSYIHTTAEISPSAHLSGLVIIDKNVIIDHGAVIKGPVYIGANTYIGTNVLLRDHTSIEANCKIGFSVEIKNSVLQPDTKIGRLSFIGDSVIGRNTQIRSGVTVQNEIGGGGKQKSQTIDLRGNSFDKLGCAIGDGADVGANSVIMPLSVIESGEEIPPGQVVKKRWKMADHNQ
ncbi:MAG: sugar phosphate nucleotidyltransferase [Candidatus Odinarchaeota archaeon]